MSIIMDFAALRLSKLRLIVPLGLCMLCLQVAAGPDPFGRITDSIELRSQLEAVALIDQNGNAFSLSQLRGDIVLLNFIFTHCSSSCPIQTQRLKAIKKKFEVKHPDLDLKLVSVSLTPEWDTSEVLAAYAKAYRIPADDSWFFLTGENYAVESVMDALGMKTSPSNKNYLDHLNNIYLFDRNGRLKKQFDGVAVPEKRLLADIVSLSRMLP